VLALAVLKHALLALTYLFMGLAARALLPPRGVVGAASMVMLPPLGWSSLHDQTHTVLVTAVTAGTWWVLVGLVRSPRPALRAAGADAGAGHAVQVQLRAVRRRAGLAALGVPAVRQVLLARGLWITAAVALVLVVPHALWLAGHWHETARAITAKMECSPGRLARRPGRAGADPAGDPAAVAAGGLGVSRRLAAAAAGWRAGRGALGLAAAGALPGAGAGGVRRHGGAGGVTEFKEHWMQPLFCVLPLAAFVARPQLESAPGGGASRARCWGWRCCSFWPPPPTPGWPAGAAARAS
jgi:hypothetical protein